MHYTNVTAHIKLTGLFLESINAFSVCLSVSLTHTWPYVDLTFQHLQYPPIGLSFTKCLKASLPSWRSKENGMWLCCRSCEIDSQVELLLLFDSFSDSLGFKRIGRVLSTQGCFCRSWCQSLARPLLDYRKHSGELKREVQQPLQIGVLSWQARYTSFSPVLSGSSSRPFPNLLLH